ncbi:Uracil-DNA glycosylase [Oceanospirillum multiglobuliferum]|uniref:Uracil-DNA glycosylase n=1 Tax=Oceanospirillum multiglobuliferum TaxID=64969 RepID=A0A1T4P6P2_9GAMM|nr:uracil-DNA glycosylase [Oceanospirillum multiglobuliferum]OPX54864.1 uracil-DNA glycosylase [Oceanospirillum multiglobuliferum]SJZ87112.1 Uracil-DNA glycosylase [Oceanospirillum multiglobuliferum]
MAIDLPADWLSVLGDEFEKPYMQQLKAFLVQEKQLGKVIYPHSSDWFNAFKLTSLQQVKVVILGQDPYHGPNQAHGLCFSVPAGIKAPPSLVNIYKELQNDLNCQPVSHGCLTAWAKQGVLLLNSVLTVEQGNAGSHQKQGWETFTDRVIHLINEQQDSVVFILWGSYAQKKADFVDQNKHLVLKSAHPSPLSAYRGFFGHHPFSQANAFLQQRGRIPINWQLPEYP